MKRKGISRLTGMIIMGAFAAYAVWIGCLPNKRYAQVFYKMGDNCEMCPLNEQIKLAEKVIYHDPIFSNGFTRMGTLSTLNNQPEQAVLFHRQALQYDHQSQLSLLEMGIYSFRQGDMDQAFQYLTRSYAVSGHGDTINYYMGRIYERKGDLIKASLYYVRAYQANTGNMNALARIGSVDLRLGDKKSCLDFAERIRQTGKISLASELEAFANTSGKTEFMASEK